jgi:hypothetical protein
MRRAKARHCLRSEESENRIVGFRVVTAEKESGTFLTAALTSAYCLLTTDF